MLQAQAQVYEHQQECRFGSLAEGSREMVEGPFQFTELLDVGHFVLVVGC